jgi:hypothetical protein
MLIISHFHDDHINGLPQLLKNGQGKWNVKEVVLPYLIPAERLIAAAEYLIQYRRSQLSDDYVSFLVDPVKYFGDGGGDGDLTITFIRPGGPNQDWKPLVAAGEEWDRGTNGAGAAGTWLETPTSSNGDYPELDPQNTNNSKVRLLHHSSRYRLSSWYFKFYCTPTSMTPVVKNELSKAGFLDENEAINPGSLRGKDAFKNLKKIYRSVFNGQMAQNRISLLCCHGPIGGTHHLCGVHPEVKRYEHLPPLKPSRCCILPIPCHGTHGNHQMLTGDAHIDVDAFAKHFKDELDSVCISLVPHHGAERNWRCRLPLDMRNCMVWIASFGTRNNYRHPGVVPIVCLASWGRTFLPCTENCGWYIVVRP